MTKHLKHLNKFPTTYYSGRTDFLSVMAAPGETLLFNDIVNTDINSVNYNDALWTEYQARGFWTVIDVHNLPTLNDYLSSITTVSVTAFITDGGQILWPILNASDNFTFTQDSYIPTGSTNDNFIITQASNMVINNTLPLNIHLISYTQSDISKYNCTVIVNGVTLQAILTIEFVALGS